MDTSWNFTLNTNGQMMGGTNSDSRTFAGDPIGSLGRELCQNSLDVVKDNTKPVKVEFNLFDNFDHKYIIGLKKIFKDWMNDWDKKENNRQEYDFLKNGLKVFENEKIKCLRVSDFNTTGLTESNEKGRPFYNGRWGGLVRSSGVSNKGATQNGSFGIGKNAAYTSSELQTVFFSTKDEDGLEAFQGVSKLFGYIDENDAEYSGFGYFPSNSDLKHESTWMSLDKSFERKNPGTDIFITAFNQEENWEKALLESILNTFLFSIYWGKLEVSLNNDSINKNNINEKINYLISQEENSNNSNLELTKNYFELLTSPKVKKTTFSILHNNDVELYISFEKKFEKNTIAMVRQNGMKIFDSKPTSRGNYCGFLWIKNEDTNEFFKKMENPEHNKWESKRFGKSKEEQNKAKKIKAKLTREIGDYIKSTLDQNTPDAIDAIGLSDFFPEFNSLDDNKNKVESLSDNASEKFIFSTSPPSKRLLNRGEHNFGKSKGKENAEGKEIIDKPGLNKGGGNPGGVGSEKQQGSIDENGNRPVWNELSLDNLDIRSIISNNIIYLFINPKSSLKKIKMQLYYSGEEKPIPLRIKNATFKNEALNIIDNENLYIENLIEDINNKITIHPVKLLGKTLEVKMYEAESK